jgi:N-acetylneuraminate synthase/sialic acid synthase
MNILRRNLDIKPIFIAEVGQNHQGDINLAKKYINIFSKAGADIIKFQSRDNKNLFDKDSYNAIYNSENSFGKSYGEHRESLELNKNELKQLKNECKKNRVAFMCTPFDENSLDLICDIGVDLIKIASFDLGNLPFIKKIASKKKPVVMSVGGGNDKQILASVKLLQEYKINTIILHCVSEYPCEYNRLDLGKIKKIKKKFPKAIVGSSDHYNGILSGPIAYLQGARVFEKHVTLNRGWKGSDHSFALEPEGFRKFVRDTERAQFMIKSKSTKEIGKEIVFQRLGKSLITNKKIKAGSKISINDLSGKIFLKQYIPVRESINVIGKVARRTIEKNEFLTYEMIK